MELWDIYDKDKNPTGRTMKRNDWCLKDDEYHLTVLGVVERSDHTYLITKRVMTKAWAPGGWEVSGGAAQLRYLKSHLTVPHLHAAWHPNHF